MRPRVVGTCHPFRIWKQLFKVMLMQDSIGPIMLGNKRDSNPFHALWITFILVTLYGPQAPRARVGSGGWLAAATCVTKFCHLHVRSTKVAQGGAKIRHKALMHAGGSPDGGGRREKLSSNVCILPILLPTSLLSPSSNRYIIGSSFHIHIPISFSRAGNVKSSGPGLTVWSVVAGRPLQSNSERLFV